MFTIRPMRREDNAAMLRIIQQCVLEFGYTHSPYVTDAENEGEIFEHYDRPNCRMYVLEAEDGSIVGGGGFATLEGMEHLCEIMQVYFAPRARGHGMGKTLVKRLMKEAAACGYDGFYIETVPEMEAAIGLYESLGFAPLPQRLGTGGHGCCSIFMQRAATLDANEPERSAG